MARPMNTMPLCHAITGSRRTNSQAIIDFALAYSLEGYRPLTFMMLDRDLVAVSPSNTYRLLKADSCGRQTRHRPLHRTLQRGPSAQPPRQYCPADRLAHRHLDILAQRDLKLEPPVKSPKINAKNSPPH